MAAVTRKAVQKEDWGLGMRIGCCVLAIGLFAVGIHLAQASVGQEAALTDAELKEAIETTEELYAKANDLLRDLPQDRFDRARVVEGADFKPERIVDWVEKNTRWVLYQGVLRGAKGVLLDRQGNSLDRSLLLSALLEDAGHETRLANGQLSKSAVERVLQRFGAQAFEPVATEAFTSEEARAVVGRAAEQAAALARLVKLPDSPWSAGLESTVADHWWVELKGESGWLNLDPLLSGTLENERPQAAKRFDPEELPAELFHRVTVRVVIERWDQGMVSEEIPLTHSFLAAAGTAQDLELRFVPFGFAVPSEVPDAKAEVLSVADTTQDWLPLFRTGKTRIFQQGFGRDGYLERNPAKPAVVRLAEKANNAMVGLGQEEELPEPVLSACWIEYEIHVPGRKAQIVRRELVDLIGPARRHGGTVSEFALDTQAIRERGLALQGISRILVTNSQLPPIAFEKASLELWGRQGPQLAALARLLHDPEAEEPLQRLLQEPLIPLDLLAFAVTRGELSRFRSATYLGSPNVLTKHFLLDAGGQLEALEAVDVVANEVGVMASGEDPAWRVRLEAGVLDTILEASLSAADGPSHNTAELFSSRGESTGGWMSFPDLPPDYSLPAEVQARMENAVARGRVVVAPEWVKGDVEPAWWEIDPADGTTLGIGSKGWGVELTERTVQEGVRAEGTRRGATKIGIKVSCAVVMAHLRVQNLLIMTPSGILWTPAAYVLWAQSGCS